MDHQPTQTYPIVTGSHGNFSSYSDGKYAYEYKIAVVANCLPNNSKSTQECSSTTPYVNTNYNISYQNITCGNTSVQLENYYQPLIGAVKFEQLDLNVTGIKSASNLPLPLSSIQAMAPTVYPNIEIFMTDIESSGDLINTIAPISYYIDAFVSRYDGNTGYLYPCSTQTDQLCWNPLTYGDSYMESRFPDIDTNRNIDDGLYTHDIVNGSVSGSIVNHSWGSASAGIYNYYTTSHSSTYYFDQDWGQDQSIDTPCGGYSSDCTDPTGNKLYNLYAPGAWSNNAVDDGLWCTYPYNDTMMHLYSSCVYHTLNPNTVIDVGILVNGVGPVMYTNSPAPNPGTDYLLNAKNNMQSAANAQNTWAASGFSSSKPGLILYMSDNNERSTYKGHYVYTYTDPPLGYYDLPLNKYNHWGSDGKSITSGVAPFRGSNVFLLPVNYLTSAGNPFVFAGSLSGSIYVALW